MTLSQADKDFYREHGFVLLRGLFGAASVAAFEKRFEEIVNEEASRPPGLVLMRDVMVARGRVTPKDPLLGVNKILSFEKDEILFGHSLDRTLLSVVRALIGPSLMTISTNVFNKPPGVDGRHPLHQDLRYFSLRPADRIVGTWTAISPASRKNGCLSVIPGSHLQGLRKHEKPDWEYTNEGFLAAEGVSLEERTHVEMAPGDTVLMHPLLVHGSGQNRSDGFRRAISTHYASRECERPPGSRKRAPVIHEVPDLDTPS